MSQLANVEPLTMRRNPLPFLLSGHARWQPQPEKRQVYAVSASGPSTALLVPQGVTDIWQQVGTSITLSSQRQLKSLEQFYAFRRREEASRFLQAYPFLVLLLLEAYSRIAEHFGAFPKVVLEVVTDPEAMDDRQLVAFIQTDLDPTEALASLDRFDRSWWLEASHRSRGKLCVHLE